jgi:orotate phosphoribosyltransferase
MPADLMSLFAARTGHYRYESGHHGSLWLDLDALFLRPARVRPFADELAWRLVPYGPAVVCGPLTGGAFLAQAVAATLGTDFAFAERVASGGPVAYRIPPGVRPALAGRAVAVVDDVINAGSAVRATLADLEECGASVVAVGALLVLGDAAPRALAARHLPLESLAARPNELWEPADCPLCAAGRPLDAIPT